MLAVFKNPANEWDAKVSEAVGVVFCDETDRDGVEEATKLVRRKWGKDVVIYGNCSVVAYRGVQSYYITENKTQVRKF